MLFSTLFLGGLAAFSALVSATDLDSADIVNGVSAGEEVLDAEDLEKRDPHWIMTSYYNAE